MAKLTKTAKGLSDQLAPVIEGSLNAVYEVSDRHKARQIKQQLKQVVHLAIAAREAGLSDEQFARFLSAFDVQTATVSGGRLEFAAAVASGLETTEGKAFKVGMNVGGSIGGFGIEAEGDYSSDSRSSMYERSSQNLRIRLDWATVPAKDIDKFVEGIVARVYEKGFTPSEPVLSEDESSPTLEAIESVMPILKDLFSKEDNE